MSCGIIPFIRFMVVDGTFTQRDSSSSVLFTFSLFVFQWFHKSANNRVTVIFH